MTQVDSLWNQEPVWGQAKWQGGGTHLAPEWREESRPQRGPVCSECLCWLAQCCRVGHSSMMSAIQEQLVGFRGLVF